MDGDVNGNGNDDVLGMVWYDRVGYGMVCYGTVSRGRVLYRSLLLVLYSYVTWYFPDARRSRSRSTSLDSRIKFVLSFTSSMSMSLRNNSYPDTYNSTRKIVYE